MKLSPHLATISYLLMFICLSGHLSPALAKLQPNQVIILANAKSPESPESLAVATHYASHRAVPPSHIVRLDLPFRDNLTRQEYDDLVVAPLRRALQAGELSSTIRVIVMTYGVPLRIEAPILSKDEKTWLAEAQSLVKTRRARLEQLEDLFTKLPPGSPKIESPLPDSAQGILEMARTMALLAHVDRTWRAAVKYVQQLPQSKSEQALQELLRLTRQYGGWGILLQKESGAGQAGTSTDTPTMAAWRWGNPLFQDSAAAPNDLPILMVSRLDALTADLAKGLVDHALQAEHSGLQGTVYFDARGLKAKDPTDTYGVYDQSLRDAAEVVKQRSEYRVVLDDAEATISKPGAAPDVAFYIGWYRLRSYEDAFTFKPGAIGYHMASAEAVTVHDRGERGWCKNALEHGITATLGSVGEPYLDAFPEPARFTTLLLTGQYSLAEVYYLTSRYVSWRMVLFGDPFYNPMRGRSRATVNSQTPLPTPPSERPIGDPPAKLAQKHRDQKDQMAMLVKLLLGAETGSAKSAR